jgi:hypothetical protein
MVVARVKTPVFELQPKSSITVKVNQNYGIHTHVVAEYPKGRWAAAERTSTRYRLKVCLRY